MKKLFFTFTLISLLTFSANAESNKIRLGWQIPWALQGQLVQTLKHTDILKKNGLEIEFIGKTFGPELNELALAGAVDVILTADQPAAVLFAKDKGWIGIGRLMYNRTATYVPKQSTINNLSALKGKVIALPTGAAAERITVAALKSEGLQTNYDFKTLNLDIKEHIPLAKKYVGQSTFGNIDALSGFDPTPALLEDENLIRVLHTGKVVSLVVAKESFLAANPQIAEKFLKSLRDAYRYYRENTAQVNTWFREESKLNASDNALSIANSLEPNLMTNTKNPLLNFSEEDFSSLQTAADFIAPNVKKTVEMKKFVTNSYVDKLK